MTAADFFVDTLVCNDARCSDCSRAFAKGDEIVCQRFLPSRNPSGNMWWTTCEPCARAWGYDGPALK